MTSFNVFPTSLAAAALRDNGYKDTAYAVAELMDNAIQANATRVSLLCAEKAGGARAQLDSIAVLDDGHGMDSETLRLSLQVGNGTRLNNRSGMGRYGVGLPSASLSQARRVDLYTWRPGQPVLYTYLDFDDLADGSMREVPVPVERQIPAPWAHFVNELGSDSGTLVVWRQLDRCSWKRAKTLLNNSEGVIGRMYRYFIAEPGNRPASSLAEQSVTIQLVQFQYDDPEHAEVRSARPNDPLYLMAPSCTPGYEDKAMFQPLPSNYEVACPIEVDGETHVVTLRFAYCRAEVRTAHDAAGNTPFGKHADRNRGVSVLRAGRELELDPAWCNSDHKERWWGVEVEFPPALDEIFGLTNNKQSARNFAKLAKLDLASLREDEADDNMSDTHFLEELRSRSNDPIVLLYPLKDKIDKTISWMRKDIASQVSRGPRNAGGRHAAAVDRATQVAAQRDLEGHRAQQSLAGGDDVTPELLGTDRFSIEVGEWPGSSFFAVECRSLKTTVTLNSDHPAYANLFSVLDENDRTISADERLRRARVALELMFLAWARYEDEIPASSPDLRRAKEMREDWGRMAAKFLEPADDA